MASTQRSSCDATYSRLVLDGQPGTVHRFTLRTIQLVLGVAASLVSIVGTSLAATWWMIGPRLDSHIDGRVEHYTRQHVEQTHAEHARMRAEWQVALAHQAALQAEQTKRVEEHMLYIRQRVDQLFNRGGAR